MGCYREDIVDSLPRCVMVQTILRLMCVCLSGVLGLKVKIMLPWDQSGKMGPKKPLPDHVSISEPKEEEVCREPYSDNRDKDKPAELASIQPAVQA